MVMKWLEVVLRLPMIFMLDISLSFVPDYLQEYCSWPVFTTVQSICVVASLCVLVASNEQLFSVYYFGIFFLHLTAILYLNVWNTPVLLDRRRSFTEIFDLDTFILLQPIAISWIVYFISIVIYALAFRSIKPVILAVSLIILISNNLTGKDETTFEESVAFGFVLFIVLQTLHHLIFHFVELVKYQIRVLLFRFRMYGILVLLVLHWRRLNINTVLCLYWILMWNYQMIIFTIFVDERFHPSFILACMSYACNSFLKVCALCYVILHVVKVLLKTVHNVVRDQHTFVEEAQHRPSGLRESIGFLFLSLYTNLTSLDPSKRIVLLELILLLLISAMIRSVFEVIEPYLLALNSTVTHSRRRHAHLVAFCICLMVLAIYMGVHLYKLRDRLPFSIPNIITVAQIFCALILYFLYTYDSHRGELWEELDDYVYYIKGACRTFEFFLIVVVLGYRVLDTSSKWTIFQIIMVILHLYVNVYLSLKDGWRSVQLRRLVNQKLNVLPQASHERLADTEDVCPICLDELKAARVTPCNHLFHTYCLKKWLNVQNKCPMCHATILERE